MYRTRFVCALGALCSISLSLGALAAPDPYLSLDEAERLALNADPQISRFGRLAQARQDQAVADGQLPDPKLKLALANFPADDFSRDKEPMTQIKVGVIQSFPRGQTLAFKQRQTEALGDVERARADDQTLKTLRAVREAWLEVHLQVNAARIVEASRDYFRQLVDITEAQYAAGRSNQQDVIRAQLELTRLDDRKTKIQGEEDTARANLSKWVGEAAMWTLADDLPDLPGLPSAAEVEERLAAHPAVRADNARVKAGKLGSDIAREQYKPGWTLDLTYGQRDGESPDGSSRPDFVSAMVVMDVPLFRDKRQDRRLAASEHQLNAARDARAERLRELKRMWDGDHARWRRLGDRNALYGESLIPESEANVESALRAYQSGVTDFTTLMRARITDLNIRIEALRLQVDRAKAHVRLLYIAGGVS